MKKRSLFVVALVMIVSAMVVVPAGAGTAVDGYMEGDFNLGVVTGEGVAPHVSWVATVDFGTDHTYYLVWYPTEIRPPLGNWSRVFEDWTIHESLTVEFTDQVITVFDPGPVLLAAHEIATGDPEGYWIAHGRTTAAADDPFGLFDASFTGMRTFWDGWVGANPFEFTGVLTLYD